MEQPRRGVVLRFQDLHGRERLGDFKTSTGENDSVRLVENSDLLGDSNRTGLDGDFRVLKFNNLCNDPITYGNLGSDWRLVFGTKAEWEVVDGV